jgi:prepilin signal peptidase PulO-like enzyme (type II secretory pathway)
MSELEDLAEILATEGLAGWLILAGAWFGACWGSFLQACFYRIPLGKSIVWPGSRCPSCSHFLSWWENQPIMGWLMLRGQCRHCGVSIPFRYLWMELVCAVITAALVILWTVSPRFSTGDLLQYSAIFYVYVLMSCIDLKYTILPDGLTLGLFFVLLIQQLCSVTVVSDTQELFRFTPFVLAELEIAVFLGLVAYLIWPLLRGLVWIMVGMPAEKKLCDALDGMNMLKEDGELKLWLQVTIFMGLVCCVWLQNLTFSPLILSELALGLGLLMFTRVLGQLLTGQEALGLGDVKLMLALILLHSQYQWLGVWGGACLLGLVTGVAIKGLGLKQSLPFGPYLCVSSMAFLVAEPLGDHFF